MKKREEAIVNAESNPRVTIPQSISEIILNSWQGDEVNYFKRNYRLHENNFLI